jgi:predicted ATPase
MAALVSPVIVGRDTELAALRQGLRDAAGGVGATFFVLGEAGIGKTRLVEAARAEAEEAGMRPLYGRAVESGTQVPFRPFAQAFQAAFRKQGGPPETLAA